MGWCSLVGWHIYCDESGDRGFPLKRGASHVYSVSLVLVRPASISAIGQHLSEQQASVTEYRGRLEWKRLSSAEKRDDTALAAFLKSFLSFVGTTLLFMTVVVNKREVRSPSLADPRRHLLIGYSYGLAFKRLIPFLSKRGEMAEVYIDRNSSTQVQNAVSEYISEILPAMHEYRMARDFGLSTSRTHGRPVFVDCRQNPVHCLADFLAGYARSAFEAYLSNGYNRTYPASWVQFLRLHRAQLADWQWSGILYHPYDGRASHPYMLPQK